MPGFHVAFSFDGDLADIFTLEFVFDQFVRVAGDLDFSDLAMSLHTAGNIDHISP